MQDGPSRLRSTGQGAVMSPESRAAGGSDESLRILLPPQILWVEGVEAVVALIAAAVAAAVVVLLKSSMVHLIGSLGRGRKTHRPRR